MADKFFKKRWHKVTTIVSAIFISLVLILAIFVNNYWSPILASKLKDAVLTASDGLYSINFSDAELHVIRGSIEVYNITLKADTAVYNRKKKERLAPNNLVELHIKRLTLSHIHPFSLYFRHKLEIGEVVFNNPDVSISYQLNHTRDTTLKANRTPWQKISKTLHSIHIGRILLGDIKFRYEDYSGNKVAISTLKEMNVSATDLLIDSATQTDKSRLLYCKDVMAELNNYTGKSANGLYTYKVAHLKLSTSKSQLNMEGLTLKPVNTDEFFAKSHKDRFTMRIDSLQLNHFDFLNYHKYRIVNASSMIVNRGAIEVFSNPNKLKPKDDRVVTFPNVGLYKIKADIKIDTVHIRHLNVFYNEHNIQSNKVGSISFNNTSGRIFNVTTNPAALLKNNTTTIKLTTYFMNRGKLNLDLAFNLTNKSNSFSVKGNLGPMDLKTLNPATMPLTMVKITDGGLKQFDFDINGDNAKAKGKIELLYANLKVNLLKADTSMDKLKKQPILSLFANLFIIKHNNPDVPGGQPRVFYANFPRPREMPFFKYVWKTLLSGIKPAIGLDQKAQEKATAIVSDRAINKKNRLAKKELRQQRRAARRAKRAAEGK